MEILPKGKQKENVIGLLYGAPGTGKSTACNSDHSIFLDIEGTIGQIDGLKTSKINSVADFREALALAVKAPGIKHLIVDTVDSYEAMAEAELCKARGWETIADGSFGQGYAALAAQMTKFFKALEIVKKQYKINVILVAHEKIRKSDDPNSTLDYALISTNLSKKTNGLMLALMDFVIYMDLEKTVTEVNGVKKVRSHPTRRVLYTGSNARYMAKNRFDWPAVVGADKDDKKLLTMIEAIN